MLQRIAETGILILLSIGLDIVLIKFLETLEFVADIGNQLDQGAVIRCLGLLLVHNAACHAYTMNIAICFGVHIQTLCINDPRFVRCRAKIIGRLQILVATHRQRTCQRTNIIFAAGIIIAHRRKGFYIKIRYGHGRTNALRAISISQSACDIEHPRIILSLDCRLGFLTVCCYLYPIICRYNRYAFAAHIADCPLQGRSVCNLTGIAVISR